VSGILGNVIRALAVLAAAGAFTPLSATASTGPATLRLQDRSPITLAGAGFTRGERVRVTLDRRTNSIRIIRAGRNGAFVVMFRGASASRCDLVRVIATGSGGSRAVLKILPAPACLPARSP
jgi:hypothetical protein